MTAPTMPVVMQFRNLLRFFATLISRRVLLLVFPFMFSASAFAEPREIEALKAEAVKAEKEFGKDHPNVATVLNKLANAYYSRGNYSNAETVHKYALAIREKSLGPEHLDVGMSLNYIAILYRVQGRYMEAEQLYKRSLSIREKSLGPEHPEVGTSLNNLAVLYEKQGRYTEAEPLNKRSLFIREKALGPEHPDVGTSLNNLAVLYEKQGRYTEAEPLYKRAILIAEETLGSKHPNVGASLNNLALVYKYQGRFAEAEPLHKRSLAIREKSLGPEHPDVAQSLNNLALLYQAQGRYPEAEPLYKRALAIREKSLGPEHPNVGLDLNNLALLYRAQRRYTEAEPLYKRALAISEKALGLEHPDVGMTLNNLAGLYQAQDRTAEALDYARRATEIFRARIEAAGEKESARLEAKKNDWGFFLHLDLLSKQENTAEIANEAFEVIQLHQTTGTGNAVAQLAVRFAQGNDALAGIVKRRQDIVQEQTGIEKSLVKASSEAPDKRNAAKEQQWRETLVRLDRTLKEIDADILARFPSYQELTRPAPLSVREAQSLLRPDEAMVVYGVGKTKTYAWVVHPKGAVFSPLEGSAATLNTDIKALRAQMDITADELPTVDVQQLHALHNRLFAPFASHIGNARHILLVPDGALQSLPFGLLVASPAQPIKSDADYQGIDWLVKRHAFSVLPSVSSLRALRQFAKRTNRTLPFAGFGDPALTETLGVMRGKTTKTAGLKLEGLFRSFAPSGGSGGGPGIGIADVNLLRRQASLPETAGELKAMASILGGKPSDLWLREAATERQVKSTDLSKYRKLAFATHGVMAGELGKHMEAGLILTPPSQGSVEDDGYLSASEIAQLNMNADWVLLSACNTAAADGTPGAEGLSGLAKAFFYAGARSLLVTHWPIDSESTVAMTTKMLKSYETNPAQGKAEAHRKATLAIMNTPNHPEYAHPAIWAPFVIVGEGGP